MKLNDDAEPPMCKARILMSEQLYAKRGSEAADVRDDINPHY